MAYTYTFGIWIWCSWPHGHSTCHCRMATSCQSCDLNGCHSFERSCHPDAVICPHFATCSQEVSNLDSRSGTYYVPEFQPLSGYLEDVKALPISQMPEASLRVQQRAAGWGIRASHWITAQIPFFPSDSHKILRSHFIFSHRPMASHMYSFISYKTHLSISLSVLK